MINVIGMKSESRGLHAYEDFLRSEAIPMLLRWDNAKIQRSFDFQEINWHWLVKDGFTEPHHPQQNPAELRAVKWVKGHCQLLMNQTGAPETMWFACAEYVTQVNNITAKQALNWSTPMEKGHGYTSDISAYLFFAFWDPVYYWTMNKSIHIAENYLVDFSE